LSSRPERSEGTCGAFNQHQLPIECATLPFVIPSEAEGSAVLQARLGNGFHGSGWLRGP
jgi:hypothetical protein